ncbi:MAG: hypothetical protein ACRBK7_08030 [Acidimicrobiales bacterium]
MLISQRVTGGPLAHLAYGAWSEAEDVLASTTGWPIGLLDRHGMEPRIRVRRIAGRVARRALRRQILVPPTRLGPTVDGAEHVFFLAHGPWDLPLLEQLKSLRGSGAIISMWMPEVWPVELGDHRLAFESYSMVDHIFVGIDEAVEPLRHIAPNSQVRVLPPAVDVERFRPTVVGLERGISILGIGRRDPAQHEELLDWASSRGKLYVYDTTKSRAIDWREHRQALANWYQHSDIAICNYAKMGADAETGGLRVLPGRLFEGLAAGAIMVGIPPDIAIQHRVLGTDVVEPLDESDGALAAMLDRLIDSDAALAIRARNIALACRGHDWGHRWQSMFNVLGIEIPCGLKSRLEGLSKAADEVEELAAAADEPELLILEDGIDVDLGPGSRQ